jgi:hypothetical protein
MATSKAWLALSALVGAGAALITTATTRSGERNSPPAEEHPSIEVATHEQPSRPITPQAAPGRVEALEQEVARLRDRGDAHDAPAPPDDPEEDRRRVAARFAEFERHLQAEPVDPAWSGGAAESLRGDLGAAARSDGFDLVAVECRTETCRATLRWSSYEAAVRTGMHLPERAIPGLNCAKSIWLEEPSNPSEPYSGNLFLDCSEQRAGTTDVIR